MIDEEATKKQYGYYSIELLPQSHKPLLARCNMCGIMRETAKNSYRKLCGSCAQKGRKHTQETREKMSEVQKGENHPLFGKHHSEETRKKMSNAHKGENNHNWKGGNIKRICETCGKEFFVRPYKIKKGEGKYCSHSCTAKARMSNAPHTQKTQPEIIFEDICKKHNLPFHFVGDGALWIGRKGQKQLNPDFIEANGKKICIEVMGTYWHSPLLNRNLIKSNLQSFRERHYKKYKWHPVFIWDTDLLRKDAEVFVLKILEGK